MRAAILVPLALLAACASTGEAGYPSLATRVGERVSGSAEPIAAPAPPPLTAETGSRIARLREQALAAHTRFAERRANAATLSAAAQDSAVASEAWSLAQVALASLEAARSEALIALADLDSLYVAAKDSAVPAIGSGDITAIGAARADVLGWVAEEDAALVALRGRLRD